MNQTRSKALLEVIRNFSATRYEAQMQKVVEAYQFGSEKSVDEALKGLPTEYQLLEAIVSKLKGKSVYTNLCKIIKNENVDSVDKAIGLSSLLTHVLIEARTNREYRMLIPTLLRKLEDIL
jgi:hypothetical protein